MSNHDNIKLLLPAYAMDVAEVHEMALVEEHLESCPICTETLQEFREVTTSLALGVDQVKAPTDLKAKVMNSIFEEPISTLVFKPKRAWFVSSFAAVAACIVLFAVFFMPQNNAVKTDIQQLQGQANIQLASSVRASYKTSENKLVVNHLPKTQNASWQIWSINRAGQKVSLGLSYGGKKSVQLPKNTELVAITQEPAKGSLQPTTDPVWQVQV